MYESRGLTRSNKVAHVYDGIHDQWTTCAFWVVPDLYPITRLGQQCMLEERNDLTKVVHILTPLKLHGHATSILSAFWGWDVSHQWLVLSKNRSGRGPVPWGHFRRPKLQCFCKTSLNNFFAKYTSCVRTNYYKYWQTIMVEMESAFANFYVKLYVFHSLCLSLYTMFFTL